MKNCLVKLQKSDSLVYDGEIVEFLSSELVPNGIYDNKVVVLIYAKKANGNIVSATSNKFEFLEDGKYEEFYPSVELNKF